MRDTAGAPVRDAVIRVWADGKRTRTLFADAAGAFRLDTAGRVELQVVESADGHRRGVRVAVAAGDRAVALTVEPGFAIAGALEQPAPRGSWLEAVDPTGAVVLRRVLKPGQTTFRIRGLGCGRHIVRLYQLDRVVSERTRIPVRADAPTLLGKQKQAIQWTQSRKRSKS
ncbi:MAG: hypothetical protein ACYTGN_11180 [Planctomycetota bacterium]